MQRSGALERLRRGGLVVLTISTMIAAGCGGGGGGGASPASAPQAGSGGAPVPPPGPDPTPGVNAPPTISGVPLRQINVGDAYDLAPAAEDPDGDALAFSIENKPSWASFNTATGQLSGTPDAADIGAYSDVVVSVSDGKVSASLPTFSITVAQAGTPGDSAGAGVELSWDVPTTLVDGGILADLTGYRIHYGRAADQLTESIEIPSAGVNRYSMLDLEPGTYYFVVRAVTATGAQSDLSNVVSVEVG